MFFLVINNFIFTKAVLEKFAIDLEKILDNGADMDKKTPKGNFPLFLVAMDDCQASLHLLLRRGAQINERTNRGMTALHIACWKRLRARRRWNCWQSENPAKLPLESSSWKPLHVRHWAILSVRDT